MSAKRRSPRSAIVPASARPSVPEAAYAGLVTGISGLLEHARRMSARSVNSILTATYWEIGRRIVEFEQGGKARAEYGEELLRHLGRDLAAKHGRGFSEHNLRQMRTFYTGWEIFQTPSGELEARVGGTSQSLPGEIWQTLSAESPLNEGMSVAEPAARKRQTPSAELPASEICSTLSGESASEEKAGLPVPASRLSGHNRLALIGAFPLPWSQYVRLMSVANIRARAFYETEAIRGGWSVRQLDRQINTQFYERSSHSKRQAVMLAKGQIAKPEDAMTAEDEVRDPYLNYAKRHLMLPEEADPVGIILCSEKDDAVVEYALGDIRAKVFASKYLTNLPDKETLRQEILNTQRALEAHKAAKGKQP